MKKIINIVFAMLMSSSAFGLYFEKQNAEAILGEAFGDPNPVVHPTYCPLQNPVQLPNGKLILGGIVDAAGDDAGKVSRIIIVNNLGDDAMNIDNWFCLNDLGTAPDGTQTAQLFENGYFKKAPGAIIWTWQANP